MSWNDVLIKLVECVTGVVISVGIPLLIKYVKTKIKNEKTQMLLDRAGEIVSRCVCMVNQTYVDTLKAIDGFDEESKQLAYDDCKRKILKLLDDEAKKAIVDTFNDIDEYLDVYIEAAVRDEKLYSMIETENVEENEHYAEEEN